MKRILHLIVLTSLLMIGGRSFAQNKHQFVDLGLPSGTLWATCNVGADYPWEYGNYYAWGETKTKTNFDWSNYKYAKGDSNKLTKYCSDRSCGNNGFIDKLTKLQPGDDVATAQWGSGWRMPTKEQWEELKQCTLLSEWTELNGVQGWLFIGTNGNQLFLPAAGRYLDKPLFCGKEGGYWSSTLADYQNFAWEFSFYWSDNGNKYVHETKQITSRFVGQPVRAVRSSR